MNERVHGQRGSHIHRLGEIRRRENRSHPEELRKSVRLHADRSRSWREDKKRGKKEGLDSEAIEDFLGVPKDCYYPCQDCTVEQDSNSEKCSKLNTVQKVLQQEAFSWFTLPVQIIAWQLLVMFIETLDIFTLRGWDLCLETFISI